MDDDTKTKGVWIAIDGPGFWVRPFGITDAEALEIIVDLAESLSEMEGMTEQ